MGSQLVKQVLGTPELIPRGTPREKQARIAAISMASIAKDDGAPPVFFAGWEQIAVALGYCLTLEDARSPEDLCRNKMNAERATRRVLSVLMQLGIAVPATTNNPTGMRQHYALILESEADYTWLPRHFDHRTQMYVWEQVPRAESPSRGRLMDAKDHGSLGSPDHGTHDHGDHPSHDPRGHA